MRACWICPLPDGSGLDAARAMRLHHPDTKVVVLSCLTDPAVVSEAKKIGVAGFLRKDQKPGSIVSVLKVVGAGRLAFDPRLLRQRGPRAVAQSREDPLGALTPRETEVLRRIVAGQSTSQMAREMDIAVSTLRGYIKSILAKLELPDTSEEPDQAVVQALDQAHWHYWGSLTCGYPA
jgi:DNA-binding NarL/FixJ family response regulator